jgi:adenylate cyclase
MEQSTRIKLAKFGVIVIGYTLAGALISLYDYYHIMSLNIVGIVIEYTFLKFGLQNILAGFFGGIMGGWFLVFYINEVYSDKSYGFLMLAVALAFISIVIILTVVIGAFIIPLNIGRPTTDPVVQQAYWAYLLDPLHLKNIIAWSVVVTLSQFLMQVNNKFGNGVLWDFITGKYHEPREEERVFMFLDLNSSTTLAEKLGHKTYHYLLRDFFADVNEVILNSHGEIYQYAGDEIIISWEDAVGTAEQRCVQCFFDIKNKINSEVERYKAEYGIVPTFKAGVHFGRVTAGEVGVLKREITFSGDVLNTTSRIQSQCKEMNVEALFSDELLARVKLSSKFLVKHMGTIKLRGKEKEVGISTVSLQNQIVG